MNCHHLLISARDFDGHAQVRRHCSFNVLENYIIEAQENDISRKLGNSFYTKMITEISTSDPVLIEKYRPLLYGSNYESCSDSVQSHRGINRALVHYAYAGYVMESGYVDSTHGLVQKINQDSIPVPLIELRNLHDRHRRIASNIMSEVMSFLCHNRDVFPEYKGECGCCDESHELLKTVRSSTFKIIKRD